VMIVILATLGLRNATLVGLAIPGSFFVGIIFLNALGITMNIVVLFSLILVAGMLVDGVIVTTEYADRRIAMGINRRDAYKDGAQRMAWPIISSTITTLMVFMPLLFWPGIVGQFMQYLPMTVMAVLTASLAMALVFIPVLGGLIGKRRVDKGAISATAPRLYRHILKFAVRRPIVVLAAVLAFMGVSYSGYIMAGYGVAFFPDIEPDQARCRYWHAAICRPKNVTSWSKKPRIASCHNRGCAPFTPSHSSPARMAVRPRATRLVPSEPCLTNGTNATRRSR